MAKNPSIPFDAQLKTSYFNTALAQMERIAANQNASNEYQFKRDYVNWAKVIEILYKEVYSKCTEQEIIDAKNKISEMNKAINLISNSQFKRGSFKNQGDIFNKCMAADFLIRVLMENHKLGSPAKDNIFSSGFIQD